MPRIARGLVGGFVYHILNRGNGKQEVFHKDQDYEMYEQITATMTNLNNMTANLEELSAMLGDSSPEIKMAMQNVNRAMDEAIGLMTTLQNSVWLRGASKKMEQRLKAKPIEGDVREGGYAPELDYNR